MPRERITFARPRALLCTSTHHAGSVRHSWRQARATPHRPALVYILLHSTGCVAIVQTHSGGALLSTA
eukprot:5121049-Prymnesium_polylepis.2